MNNWFQSIIDNLKGKVSPSKVKTPVKVQFKKTTVLPKGKVSTNKTSIPSKSNTVINNVVNKPLKTAFGSSVENTGLKESINRNTLNISEPGELGKINITKVESIIPENKNLIPFITQSREIKSYPEASGDILEELKGWSGEIITAPGGSIPLPEKCRKFVAMLSDYRLLIEKNKQVSNEVLEAKQILSRQGKPVDQIILVDMELLTLIYRNHEKNHPKLNSKRGRSEGLQEMQREVINEIKKAHEKGASDIHIQVKTHIAQIEMRVKGVIIKTGQMSSDVAMDFCNAAFNMADASDSTYQVGEYQGARISNVRNQSMPDGVQSVRLQFNPLPDGGRNLVIRLLTQKSNATNGSDIDTLGYSWVHIKQIKNMRRRPYGLNIICGPTGSGKSTTLARLLSALMHEVKFTKKLITVEDPPEFIIEGAVQLQVVNAKSDKERSEAFRLAISSTLRSDPDYIMIGEIRDEASAKLSFTASMTGHGVWASIHANNSIGIISRLRNLNVDAQDLMDYTIVTGLISQRLVCPLCPNCSVPFNKAISEQLIGEKMAKDIINLVGEERAQNVRACSGVTCGSKGCENGTIGREVCAETIIPDGGFMELMSDGKRQDAYDYWLDKLDGMTMAEHALQKIVAGRLSPHEMISTFGEIQAIDKNRITKIFGLLLNEEGT